MLNALFWKKSVAATIAACVAGVTGAPAGAQPLRAPHAKFMRVGHDSIDVNPAVRRFTGMVTALGTPDGEGRIYSFQVVPIGPGSTPPASNELRGWRLTVLAGQRFASVFEVRSNTESEVTIGSQDGPLNGLAVRDVFIIEEIAIERAPPASSAPQGSST